jgi:hypothetical protein
MYEPDFPDASTLVNRQFDDLVVSCSRWGKNLGDPVGRAAHAPYIEFLAVAHNQDVWLHHCIDLLVSLIGTWQTDIKRSDICAAGFIFECEADLEIQLSYELLMEPQGSRRLSDKGNAIDQLIALALGPSEIVGVSKVRRVAQG